MSGSLSYFMFSFLEPILANRLKEFELTQVQISFSFVVVSVFYIPTSVLIQRIPPTI